MKILAVIVLVVIATIIGRLIGGEMGRQAAEKRIETPKSYSISEVLPAAPVKEPAPSALAVADQMAPIISAVTIQETEGPSEADLDLPALKRLEEHMVQTTLKRARANYAKQGFDPNTYNPKVDVGSVYVVAAGKKLAVIRMTIDAQVRTTWVMGFNQGQFLRVTCIRASNHDIPLFSGECGQKVTEAFAVSLKPQESVAAETSSTGRGDLNAQVIEAARSGNVAAVASLVGKGAEVNAKTSLGYSALSGAAGKGHTEVIRFLLGKGVNVNERLRGGTNALDEASFWGHVDAVKLLLAKGANPNMKKDNGYTPLLSAAMNGHVAIVKLLLDNGGDVNARSKAGGTGLHAAAVQKHNAVIDLLLKRGADPTIRNEGGYTYRDVLAARR